MSRMSDAQVAPLSSSSPESRPRRRWYQFGLRSLFLLVTVAVGCVVIVRSYVEPYQQQRHALEAIKALGGKFETSEAPGWQRRLFGADFQDVTALNLADCDKVDEYLPHVARLPGLQTLVVGGANFGDDHLGALRLPALRTLVLDSTSESPQALAEYQQRFSEVTVVRSHRRAIPTLEAAGFEVKSEKTQEPENPYPLVSPEFFVHALTVRCPGLLRNPEAARALQSARGIWLVDLRRNTAADPLLQHLRQVGHDLVSLHLSDTFVGSSGIAHLSGFKKLEALYLNGTRVDDDGLAHLTSIDSLRFLVLDNTPITDAGLPHLISMRGLQLVSLRRTSVTAAGIHRLEQLLPDCSVVGP
jgi:hypothetical protein